MKKLLLLIIPLLALSARSQTSVYYPFPDSDAAWNVSRTGGSINCRGTLLSESFSYTLAGDTNINGNDYHQLIIPHVQYQDTCSQLHTKPGYAGCISQDTAAKKVFFISPNDTTRYILYDFTLQVGDTVSTPASLPCFAVETITGIDSILVGTLYRKRWSVSALINPPTFIEGIGSTSGLLQLCGTIPDAPTYTLDCFAQNSVPLYPDAVSPCNVVLSVKDNQQAAISASISPNPFHTNAELEIDVELLKDKKLSLQIYDMTGRMLMQQTVLTQITILNRGTLSEGMYFYRILGAGGEVAKGKFVIN